MYHYFGSEEGSTELVSQLGVLVCVCVSHQCWQQRLRSAVLAFEDLRVRETHSDEFLFLLSYSASALFLRFLLLCFVSFFYSFSLLSPHTHLPLPFFFISVSLFFFL